MSDKVRTKPDRKSGKRCTHERTTTDATQEALYCYDKGVLSASEAARIIFNMMTLKNVNDILLLIHGRIEILRELIVMIRGWTLTGSPGDLEA
jgi:hypothetical protein